MWGDKVLEEVRAVREAQAARFNFDLQAIVDDLRRREAASGHPVLMPATAQSNSVAPNSPLQEMSCDAEPVVS